MVQSSPIVDLCFSSLSDPELFDICVDIICEVILKSSTEPKDQKVIQTIFPKLVPLGEFLQQNMDDPDIVRGVCRILVEAGEGYMDMLISHSMYFQSIISSIIACAAYDDLEVAKITFNVWYLLADQISANADPNFRTHFVPIYQQLITVIIKHLEYPADLTAWKSQERDEFKEFRYIMGDVLKDCVRVLGQDSLNTPYSLLRQYFAQVANGSSVLNTSATWQQIEAPLFSLRAMCREVSLQENKYLPEIMEMLPLLPPHPKIKYAAILVIGRYAEWTNVHPEMLSYQLDFVSNGFETVENQNASSSTFRDLCKYCPSVSLIDVSISLIFWSSCIPFMLIQ
jgi:transportin-3